MDQNEIKELLRLGIEAARNNNRIIARNYFRQVLDIDPGNESAWLWMAQSADRIEDRQDYLERVLKINPNNDKARAALEKIYAATAPEKAAAEPSVFQRAAARRAEGYEENRDWLRPVDRPKRDEDLWSKRRKQENYIPQIIIGVLGLGFIGLAIYLLIQQQDENSQANTTPTVDFAATETAVAFIQSFVTPSNTPRPTSPLMLTPRDNRLPPTIAPTITSTPRPTATATPGPNPPEDYGLIFVSNTIPGEPSRLFTSQGEGSNLTQINIQIPALPFGEEPEADTPPEDEATPEAETETPNGEDNSDETTAELPARALLAQEARYDLLDPALSPDGQTLVFTVERSGTQELFTAPVTGGVARQLTQLGAIQTRYAAWSPDGQYILFASDVDGDFELYALLLDQPADGDPIPPAKLTDNEFDDRQPVWSPDGRYIAFASDRAGIGELEIFVMPFSGSDPICQMTDATGSSFSPSWSPDGSQIAFISNRGGDNDLYIMRYDGSAETLITVSDGDWQDRDPAWSPDGQWLVMSSTRVDGPSSAPGNPTSKLWILTPNGSEWHMITSGESNDTRPIWTNQLPPEQEPIVVSNFEFRCASR